MLYQVGLRISLTVALILSSTLTVAAELDLKPRAHPNQTRMPTTSQDESKPLSLPQPPAPAIRSKSRVKASASVRVSCRNHMGRIIHGGEPGFEACVNEAQMQRHNRANGRWEATPPGTSIGVTIGN